MDLLEAMMLHLPPIWFLVVLTFGFTFTTLRRFGFLNLCRVYPQHIVRIICEDTVLGETTSKTGSPAFFA